MSNPFVPIKKADLVWHEDLPFSIQYNDIYYSKEGGLAQSRHVFIEGNQLIQRWEKLPNTYFSKFTIAETGFGTGLNFLLAWSLWEEHAPPNASFHYISCEKHPIDKQDLICCLRQWPEFSVKAEMLVEKYPVLTPGNHRISFCNGRVILTLMLGEALECFEQMLICGEPNLESELRNSFVDAWFLDGFAPKYNPAMWSKSLIRCIAMLSTKGTTLATYTAAQAVKSILTECGFTIDKRKGFGPKRHMITAFYDTNRKLDIKRGHTAWHIGTSVSVKDKHATIIGAGLAGCFVAYFLAIRGWKVTLIEKNHDIGKGASGNEQAVLFPKLSSYRSPLTQFMLSAYLYANHFYREIIEQHELGELKGSLLLAYNDKEQKAQHSLEHWLQYYPELGTLVDSNIASEYSGVSISQSGLFLPLSGWINSPKLCQFLIDHPNINLITNRTVKGICFEDSKWIIDEIKSEVVVIANGNYANYFEQTEHLPIKYIKGQMSKINVSKESALLKIPVCGDGHVLPSVNETHRIGATYDLGVNETNASAEADLHNINKLLKIAPNVCWNTRVINHWVGVRASTPDYIPLIGPVAQEREFLKEFANLDTNSKRWIPKVAPFHPGLYICAAFGSRGLTTIPLCADWLAGMINNELGSLPKSMVQAFSPARFLRRQIIRGKQ